MWGAEEPLILGVGGPRAFFVNKNRSMKVLGRDNASNESPSNSVTYGLLVQHC